MDGGVTILILIDGFLQLTTEASKVELNHRHNPYFNRWFSAIKEMVRLHEKKVTILILIDGFLQYL